MVSGAARSGSTPALAVWVSLTRTACGHWYAPGGYDPYLRSVGRLMARVLGRGVSPRATLVPTAVCTHGRTGGIDAYSEAGHTIFDMALRFDSNGPCELSHISLTAHARSAQWTGVYAHCLDALARSGAVTIVTSITTAMRNLAVRRACIRLLRPKSNLV